VKENTWDIWIGNSPVDNRPFDGIIDEVRISSVVRSENWMLTEYQNMMDYGNFLIITSGGGGGNPTWVTDSGPHGSGSYQFDGLDDCFQSSNNVSSGDGNDIEHDPDTTALWFKTDGTVTSEQYMVYWDGAGTCPNCDYYKIALDSTGKVVFEFDTTTSSGGTSTCTSTNQYDDDVWYHVTAVRGANGDVANDYDCTLYIHGLDGTILETIIQSYPSASSDSVSADGRWTVGTNQEKNDKFFKGYIDDVMHWNDKFLISTEANALAKTNYGDAAHRISFYLTSVDSDGNNPQSIVSDIDIDVPFIDPKSSSSAASENDDSLYSYFNYTMVLPQQTFVAGQRVNFTMNWTPATSTWEPLDADIKVDDTGFTSPFPSYIQVPPPSNPFPSYYIYDNDVELDIWISNTGTDGIYYIAQGTRANFENDNGSYAGLIHYINGTSSTYVVDENQDSIFVDSGELARMYFYIPTDHPSSNGTPLGTIIPPDDYRLSIWVQGYSDQGETFSRSVILGTVTVVD